ncbi:MAG: hypothetical protein WCI51_02445 [Lentisphaerota bacterium]
MFRLATFKVDCTPPTGAAVGLNFKGGAEFIRDPLYLRGHIFSGDGGKYVIASMDYCTLLHSAYEQLQAALAEGAGTGVEHTVIHCIHQHDAPLIDFEAAKYIHPQAHLRFAWFGDIVDKCRQAAAAASNNFIEITETGFSECRLHGYASNRRMPDKDGRIQIRLSRGAEQALKDLPVGTIDPMLRTCAFKDIYGGIVATMSFYATHPQVANTGNKFSADAPGEAIRLLEEEIPEATHAFFTGAGGNVTAGKYTSADDLEGNILKFGRKLADGIASNINGMKWEPSANIAWRKASFPFPAVTVDRNKLIAMLQKDPARAASAAAQLGAADFNPSPEYVINMLQGGNIRLVFLPGEPFVEYQLYIQSLIPDEFVAVAANCRDDFLYLPLSASFSETGGYETEYFCRTTPEFEPRFKTAIAGLISRSSNK